jgi:uncharacterized protein (TIGR02611 family)
MEPREGDPDERESERLLEAAYQAELETGRREETKERARASIRLRLIRMTAGFGLLIVGGLLLILPGPGWLCIAAGLAILSRDVAWAERALARVQARLPRGSDGHVPKGVVAGSVIFMLAGAGVSVWLWWR